MPTDQIAGTNPAHVLQSLVCVTKITLMFHWYSTNITSHCFYDQQKVEAVKQNWGYDFPRQHMWIGATSHNTLLFFVWDFTHTHKHTQRDAQREWIYGLVICEKAKPPLNRRHSNSFFFLPKWAFKTRYVAKCAWIDVKRLHHHGPPRRHPRAGRASASFRLRGYCAISPRARLLLLLLLYVPVPNLFL